MAASNLLFALYAAPLAAVWAIYAKRRKLREGSALAKRDAAIEAGLTEPASLHPVIDPALCIGCGACVTACPEGDILGLVNGKAMLVEPSHCIGHGACAAACPLHGIALVFGTERRGVDIPHVGADFQTNVPGIFIAGELGGMGLIRNAIEQGRQAMMEIAKRGRTNARDTYDVAIVGAGPAGISATLAAKEQGFRSITLEQDSFGGTVAHFPRGKLVMTRPATLPLYGKVQFRETTKETLLDFWQTVADDTGIRIEFNERVDTIAAIDGGFELRTVSGAVRAKSVLLAIGRRGTPRKLDVAGELQGKVVYRLIDAEQYRGRHVLVVGGGDSALEAAASIAEQPDTTVTLSYRGDGFSRAKPKNRERIAAAENAGNLSVLLNSAVRSIGKDHVDVDYAGAVNRLKNDAVIVCAGGILPTQFLKSVGVSIETKYGSA